MEKALRIIATVRSSIARARKAVVPAVATLGLIIGTDSPTYVDVVSILVTLGVYGIPNRKTYVV